MFESIVWVIFLDEKGAPLQQTTAHVVRLHPFSNVTQLKDRAKELYVEHGYLTDVPAQALKIYKNFTAFQNGEPPVELDCLAGTFYSSKLDPVVIVVPRQSVHGRTLSAPPIAVHRSLFDDEEVEIKFEPEVDYGPFDFDLDEEVNSRDWRIPPFDLGVDAPWE